MSDHETKPSCEQIIDILPDPFVVIDRNYRIVAANRNYVERFGMTADEVIGQRCHRVSHHSDVPCSQHGEHCPLEMVFESGEPTQVMHIHYDKDGREEYVQLQANPIRDEAGDVLYMGEYINPVQRYDDRDTILAGRSRPMLRMISMLQRVAPTQTTVLLLGESGVGKECVAQYVHQYSGRHTGPFVVVDCASFGETLIESELFGYEKGAFTGATYRRKGLFEAAHGGTLFIDEVGELPLSLQTKLLRVLETGTVRRVGGTDYIKVDVRVVVATHRNLRKMVQEGAFREDLYYRLSAFPVSIPALRDRKDDIPLLAEHFLHGMEEGVQYIPLPPAVIETLLAYDYPGNVRELRNIIERAVILAAGGAMTPEHIVLEVGGSMESVPLADVAHPVDRDPAVPTGDPIHLLQRRNMLSEQTVLDALQRAGGHRREAARLLGVSERTVYRYMQKLRD
ncbi:MAG: sigma 54-interacting transcriptional regulator [Acidiferrobacteraceae bacterium]|jgi:two-component system response regulator AtoC